MEGRGDEVLGQISRNGAPKTKELAEMALIFRAVGDSAVQGREMAVREGAIAEVAASTTGSTLNTEGAMQVYKARQQAIADEYSGQKTVGEIGRRAYTAMGGPVSKPPVDPHRDARSQLFPFPEPTYPALPPSSAPVYSAPQAIPPAPQAITACATPVQTELPGPHPQQAYVNESQPAQQPQRRVVYRKRAPQERPVSQRREEGSLIDVILMGVALTIIVAIVFINYPQANPLLKLIDQKANLFQADGEQPASESDTQQSPPPPDRQVIEVMPLPVQRQ